MILLRQTSLEVFPEVFFQQLRQRKKDIALESL
jgi:hypothetical protein